MRDKDYLIAFGIGEAVALILLAISANIEELAQLPYLWISVFLLPLLAVFGFWLTGLLARRLPVILQMGKYVLTGILNTFIDLGILNFFIWVFARASGWSYPLFKTISFSLAVVNSYFFNKFWTFQDNKAGIKKKQFSAFYFWTGFAFLLNVGIASFIVNVIGPQWGISEKVWANLGAIAAVLLVCVWNFLGYKFIIFKK